MPTNHRNRRLVLAALLGIAALGIGTAADAAGYSVQFNASRLRAKPDLVIRSFHLKRWGHCKVNQPVFTFQVTVANIGHAPSPAIPGKAMVQVKDQHHINWGNGALLGAIVPGGSRTVNVPVYYLQPDPAHMTAAAPHPFRAFVDPLHLVSESNEGNNASRVIKVDPRHVCHAAGKTSALGAHSLFSTHKLQ